MRRLGASALESRDRDFIVMEDPCVLFERDARRRERRARRDNGLDTDSALARAEARYEGRAEEVLARTAAAIAAAGLKRPSSRSARLAPCAEPVAILEDHARLDVQGLARAGLFRPGETTGVLLDWSDTPAALSVQGFVDLTQEGRAMLTLECVVNGQPCYQAIGLVRSTGERASWRAVCPVRGVEVRVLAFRAGRFASREAQRLVNRSQRRGPKPEGS